MKKLLLSLLFCSTMLFSFSQFTATNHTSTSLTVGVQFTSTYGSCTPSSSDSQVIAPFSSYTFTIPPGDIVLRVGYWAGVISAWQYAACGGCTLPSSTPGPYGFWGYTCSTVYIR